MDYPKCRLCGEKHRLGDAHIFKDSAPVAATKHKAFSPTPQVVGFDPRAYQKAYMRVYRRRQTLMVQTAQALLGGVAERWPRG